MLSGWFGEDIGRCGRNGRLGPGGLGRLGRVRSGEAGLGLVFFLIGEGSHPVAVEQPQSVGPLGRGQQHGRAVAERGDRRMLFVQGRQQAADVRIVGQVDHRTVAARREDRVELGHLRVGQRGQRDRMLEAGNLLQRAAPLVREPLALGPLRVDLALDVLPGQAVRGVLGQHISELPVLPPRGLRGRADDPVGLGRGAAVRLQERGHAAGGGQAELGVLVQGQPDVVDVVGEGAHHRGQVVLVLVGIVEKPRQPVRIRVRRFPVGRDHRDVESGVGEPLVGLERLFGEVAGRVGRAIRERHLARAGDEVRDPGHTAPPQVSTASAGFVIVTLSSHRRDIYGWR